MDLGFGAADSNCPVCGMARKGQTKYNTVRGHGQRLLELRAAILNQFDPGETDRCVQASVRRRQLARQAMNLIQAR